MWVQSQNREENDLYATRPHDVHLLYQYEPSIIEGKIWECACGHGHIVRTLQELGATDIYASDLVDYGFGYNVSNFLMNNDHNDEFDTILTNPPYKYAMEFIIHALKQVKTGGRVIMLLPITVLSGITRYKKIYRHNKPKYIYVFARKTYGILANKGDDQYQAPNLSHCWVIWEKGYKDDTVFRWLCDKEDDNDYKTTIPKQRIPKSNNTKPRKPELTSNIDENGNILPPGIRKKGSTWEVRIKVDGRYIHIGRYTKQIDAINARRLAEIKYRGESNINEQIDIDRKENDNEQTDTGAGC